MTEKFFGGMFDDLPLIAEQDAIRAHNGPILNALSIAVKIADRLYGDMSAEYGAVCRLYDQAWKLNSEFKRIDDA